MTKWVVQGRIRLTHIGGGEGVVEIERKGGRVAERGGGFICEEKDQAQQGNEGAEGKGHSLSLILKIKL